MPTIRTVGRWGRVYRYCRWELKIVGEPAPTGLHEIAYDKTTSKFANNSNLYGGAA
jgi:hypothetical protein